MSVLSCSIGGDIFPENADLSLKIIKCGEEFCRADKVKENDWRKYNSLHFVLYGEGSLVFGDGKIINLKRGDIFILPKDKLYEFSPSKSNPWTYAWVDFACENPWALFANIGLTENKPYMLQAQTLEMEQTVHQMVYAYVSHDSGNIKCMAYFMLLLGMMAENNNHGKTADVKSQKFQVFRSILTFINNNYRLNLSVDEWAQSVGLSSSYFYSLFPEMIGMTPKEYINRFRISIACVFIQSGREMTIKQLSEKVGYNDLSYFSKIFAKIVGMSPREYIKRGIKEEPFDWLIKTGMDFRYS